MFICEVLNFELLPTLEMMWASCSCHVYNLKAFGFLDYTKSISCYLINVKFVMSYNIAVGKFLFFQHVYSSAHS